MILNSQTAIDDAVQLFLLYRSNRKGSPKSTIDTYSSIISDFIANMNIKYVEDITIEIIDQYLDGLFVRNYKPKTHSNKAAAIRSFVRYLYSKNATNIRPESVEIPTSQVMEANFLDPREQLAILGVALSNKTNIRDRAIVSTLLRSGLRVSELCDIRYDDLYERSIVVRCGKGKKPRVTFIDQMTEEFIETYLATKNRTEYLFTNRNGERLSRQYVHRLVCTIAEKAGIDKNVTPHTLRHTFATNLLRNGARIEDVQPMMGHANITTTRLYMHFTNDYLHARYDEFSGSYSTSVLTKA